MLRLLVPAALLATAGCGALLDFDPQDPDAGSAADLGLVDGGAIPDGSRPDGGGLDASRPDAARPDAGCAGDSDCDDGLFCNGAERCTAGTCVASPAPGCDGAGCAHGDCSDALHGCTLVPDDTLCAASQFCSPDGVCRVRPTCATRTDCMAVAPPCFDGDCVGTSCVFAPRDCGPALHGCAHVACDTMTNRCVGSGDRTLCDDFIACTFDQCNVDPTTHFGTCSSLPSPDPTACDDGIGCTDDVCAPSTCSDSAGCTHVPSDGLCRPWASSLALPPPYGVCSRPICAPTATAADSATGCLLAPVCPITGCGDVGGVATCLTAAPLSCSGDSDCDDGNPCDGIEMCLPDGSGGGACSVSAILSCPGGIANCAYSPPPSAGGGGPTPVCLPPTAICDP